jgi:hypothetical protein
MYGMGPLRSDPDGTGRDETHRRPRAHEDPHGSSDKATEMTVIESVRSEADYWVCPDCRSLNTDLTDRCYSCRARYRPYDPDRSPLRASVASPSAAAVAARYGPIEQLAPPTIAALEANGIPASIANLPRIPIFARPEPAQVGLRNSVPLTGVPFGRPEVGGRLISALEGLVAGATAAVAIGLAWYLSVALTGFADSPVPLVAGWIIALAVIHGAGRRTIWLLPVSLVATAALLVVGEYAILLRSLNETLVAAGADALPLIQPADRIAAILADGLRGDPLPLLFAAVALAEAAAVPWRHVIPPPPRPWQPVF